jgi:hypothetical protein
MADFFIAFLAVLPANNVNSGPQITLEDMIKIEEVLGQVAVYRHSVYTAPAVSGLIDGLVLSLQLIEVR